MNVLPEPQWQSLIPVLRKHCPRLTAGDLAGCQRRLDLLTAAIQNRHWVSRVAARRLALGLMHAAGVQRIAS
jgi:hypothetical protein